MSRSAHSVLASPATRATTALPPHPPTRSEGPDDPARISPLHLPALHHIAADLDGLTAPVKIVAPTDLDACTDCGSHGDGALPRQTSIATVVATDAYGFVYRSTSCALHLESLVRWHLRRECRVHVEAPATGGRRWFERTDRETYWALDEVDGIAVTRSMHDVWAVREVSGFLSLGAPLCVHPDRAVAEVLAQAVAARIAADAYEASFSDAVTVALPVVAVSGVAA